MPFTVTLPGGTKNHEFEEYVQLLGKWGIHVSETSRVAEPGTPNRWLHVWQSRGEAQRFAEELKGITNDPRWVVQELRSLVCPNCHVGLEERQLVRRTWTVESCPHCRAPVRKQESWDDRDASLRHDLAAIEAWLGGVTQDAATRGRLLTVAPEEEDGRQGTYRWAITGLAVPWACAVEYRADAPGVFDVRLTSDQDGHGVMADIGFLAGVCAEHGVQPHVIESRSWVAWGGERVEMHWGARQFLATAPLSVGLFTVVFRRLEGAMRDAVARLGLGLAS
jgi:hypothetical protein